MAKLNQPHVAVETSTEQFGGPVDQESWYYCIIQSHIPARSTKIDANAFHSRVSFSIKS